MKMSNVLPDRIQLRRVRGYKMPPRTRVCDRRTDYGNPFVVGKRFNNLGLWIAINGVMTQAEIKLWFEDDGFLVRDAAHAVELFRKYVEWRVNKCADGRTLLAELLHYEHLGCFCARDASCHVDVWLEMLKELE